MLFPSVSIIYKYKRRSSSGCSRLPGRSRLNLTQRTKHFMRSNFVRPTDVTSIKSFNITSNVDTSSQSKASSADSQGSNTNNLVKNVSKRLQNGALMNSSDNRRLQASSSSRQQHVSKQLFGPALSTFNGASSTLSSQSDRYHFTELDNRADIRTLNTRIKPITQVKSPIEKHNPNPHQSSKHLVNRQVKQTNDACYLNITHQSQAMSSKCGQNAVHDDARDHNIDLKQFNRL